MDEPTGAVAYVSVPTRSRKIPSDPWPPETSAIPYLLLQGFKVLDDQQLSLYVSLSLNLDHLTNSIVNVGFEVKYHTVY